MAEKKKKASGMQNVSMKTSVAARYTAFYKMLAVLTIAVTVSPLVGTVLYPMMPKYANLFAFVGTVGLVMLGYLFQTIFGAVANIKRVDSGLAYESTEKQFEPLHAAPPLALAGIIALLSVGWTRSLLTEIFGRFDKVSLIPYIVAVAVGALMVVGIVLWFFPFNRLISFKSLAPFGVVLLIDFALNIVFGAPLTYLTACTAFFVVSYYILMNQSFILGMSERAGFGVTTGGARFYNLSLVLVSLIVVVLLVFAALTVIVGATVSVKMLAFLALNSTARDGNSYTRPDVSDVMKDFDKDVFEGIVDIGGTAAKGFFGAFCVVIISIILFFILIRKYDVIGSIRRFIDRLWDDIMWFFHNVYYFLIRKQPDDIIISASPEFLLTPICQKLGLTMMASRVDKRTGIYTGVNCDGAEKIRRLYEAYPDAVVEHFYSDSHSDDPMAGIAQNAVWVDGSKLSSWKNK